MADDPGRAHLGLTHIVTPENYAEAQEAIRDILMLYVSMAESYSGFGHAVDVDVRFDPLKFVDAQKDTRGYTLDIDLLRTGSAVAALCFLYDLWCESEAVDVKGSQPIKQALGDGRFRFVPDVEAVAREALHRDRMSLDDPWFDEAVAPIYSRHVLGYFRRLSEMERFVLR